MFASAALAVYLRPSPIPEDKKSTIELQAIVPTQFGSWASVDTDSANVVNPQQSEALDRIYSQTLARTYHDSVTGKSVMLSIAYGGVQSKESQVHRPEVCYPAQGFQIQGSKKGTVTTPLRDIPVQRLVARLDQRTEPVTYWIRVGNTLARGWIEQKMAGVMQGASGKIADGLLFRTSTIDSDIESSYEIQNKFISDLLENIDSTASAFLIGH